MGVQINEKAEKENKQALFAILVARHGKILYFKFI